MMKTQVCTGGNCGMTQRDHYLYFIGTYGVLIKKKNPYYNLYSFYILLSDDYTISATLSFVALIV